MDLIEFAVDFILHIDKHLIEITTSYGMWAYLILFIIIFVETGLVVVPFLPGDSLLFMVGTLCATGILDISFIIPLLLIAAISGDQLNYIIGSFFGHKVFDWEHSKIFNKKAFDQAHDFYEKHGAFAVIAARFMPFLRTFIPFIAGVADMSKRKFTLYNFIGGFLWIISLILAGYIFGNIPFVKNNLEKIIWGLILIPGLISIISFIKTKQS